MLSSSLNGKDQNAINEEYLEFNSC